MTGRILRGGLVLGVFLWGELVCGAPAPKVEDLYRQHCAVCHGEDLGGGLGGSLINGEWNYGGDDASIARVIAEGIPEMGMDPYAGILSPAQIRALVVFLREGEAGYAARKAPAPAAGGGVATRHHRFRLETVAEGLEAPWAVDFLPDGRFLVTEKAGALRVVGADGKVGAPVGGTPRVAARGQGGMLDVALHPDFERNGWIYLSFSDPAATGDGALTAIVRGRIRDGQWVDHEWIWRGEQADYTQSGVHFGTRIVFDGGYVFFVVGERGGMMQAQELSGPKGKIFRLHEDGTVPGDNPFRGVAGALPGIWSHGHRNPQGLAFDRRTGDLYSTEHGPRGGDEFNLIRKGANYGWPVITHGMNYNGTPLTAHTEMEGMEQPVIHWTPSTAACGLAQYDGNAFPRWRGDFFAGGLASRELRRLRVRDRTVIEQELVLKGAGRIRDVKTSPDGFLYLLLNDPDRLVRLVPAAAGD
jgi:aldose sugar dehydrogenase